MSPHVRTQASDREIVIIDAVTQEVYIGNATAQTIWTALRHGEDTDALEQQLLARFGDGEAVTDLRDFVEMLLEKRWIIPR